jgi:uncharacterized protein (TIGR02145 family)
MKFKYLLLALLFLNLAANAQNVGIGTTTPNASAKLEVSSTNSGFLPPRMTFAQRNAIANPSQGLIIYCTDCGTKGQAQIFDGTDWTDLTGASARPNVIVDSLNNVVTIGTQTWSSKNLNVDRYRNGDVIPQVTDPLQWENLNSGAWCWYNNDSDRYGSFYGRLYNWYAVSDARGLAPQGWHIPSDFEWSMLETYLGGSFLAGGAMKCAFCWYTPNTDATNYSGFSAMPGSYRSYWGVFDVNNEYKIGTSGFWWSSTNNASVEAYNRALFNNSNSIKRNSENKSNGFSVRCIKD